ncbi:polysaccharide deacetylase [Streptomyces sp. NPDC048416]|uniref:polysaccharide deacetylase n=1 Tax=Streptomyces sp. NPDC048416 TaxID=3365546 RepID=UPI00372042AB
MKKTMTKAAGVVLGLALAGTLGGVGTAEAQVQPSVTAPTAAPAISAAGTSGPAVQTPASVVADLKAATSRARAALAPNARVICYAAHVQDIGWQAAVCDGAVAGTTGQSRRMEALAVSTSGVGGVCADAHLADIGWQGWACGSDGQVVTVGTTGQSRRMEALGVQVGSGSVGAQAHVEGYGWLSSVSGNPVYAGTTGQSRRMEAVRIWV